MALNFLLLHDQIGHSSTKLQLLTRGTLISVAWSDQKVDIKTSPLSETDVNNDGDVILEENREGYLAKV